MEGSLLVWYLPFWRHEGRNVWSNRVSRFSKKTNTLQKLGITNQVFCLLQGREFSWPPEPESSFHLTNDGQQHWYVWASNAKIKTLSAGYLSNLRGTEKAHWTLGDCREGKCLLPAPLLGSIARRFWLSPRALPSRMKLACSTMCSWGLGPASLLSPSAVGNLFLSQQKSISFSPTPRTLTDPICAAALLWQLAQDMEEHQWLGEEEGECSWPPAPLLFPLLK